ncbi:MAG TPA: GxxExxY protein [Gemmatimonadaceae bacterium]|nr:GxxExxY protein [Gemmatimonadaceae bacterium]
MIDRQTERIIAAAIEVHRHLGPGLLESAYVECLVRELTIRGIPFQREVPLPVRYRGVLVDVRYKLDLLVYGDVVVECKSVERLAGVHKAQVLTYLRLGEWSRGLLINFNCAQLVDGVRRVVNRWSPPGS